MIFDKDTFTDTIFGLTKIKENWANPELKVELTLLDKGITFNNFIWDRNGGKHTPIAHYSGVNDLKWDQNLIWDFELGPTVTSDTASYQQTKKVSFS